MYYQKIPFTALDSLYYTAAQLEYILDSTKGIIKHEEWELSKKLGRISYLAAVLGSPNRPGDMGKITTIPHYYVGLFLLRACQSDHLRGHVLQEC